MKRTQRIVQAVGSSQLLKVDTASKCKLRSTRVLTYTEVNTEASAMVRVWRISGVIRLWHVQRDAHKNLGAPSRP